MSSKAPSSRFLPFSGDSPATSVPAADIFEFDQFDEFDLWTPSSDDLSAASGKAEVIKRPSGRAPRRAEPPRRASTSAPVNIPDWSRIAAHSSRPAVDEEEYDSEGEEEVSVDVEEKRSWEPPHEYLARQVARRRQRRGSVSCSVEEGAGGTLKGRELWRVRDAIWEKIGFQD